MRTPDAATPSISRWRASGSPGGNRASARRGPPRQRVWRTDAFTANTPDAASFFEEVKIFTSDEAILGSDKYLLLLVSRAQMIR